MSTQKFTQKIPVFFNSWKRSISVDGSFVSQKRLHLWRKFKWENSRHFVNIFTQYLNFSVSKKHVLTAAHCIVDKGDYELREPQDSFFYLWKYDLNKTEPGEVKALVEKFVLHPDWDTTKATRYIGDLAIAYLKVQVTYTDYIRPICLNSSPTETLLSFRKINGTVTGWGTREGHNGVSVKAREVVIPMVNSQQCYKSSITFFFLFSDDSSFCAGKQDGSGPCKGYVEFFLDLRVVIFQIAIQFFLCCAVLIY